MTPAAKKFLTVAAVANERCKGLVRDGFRGLGLSDFMDSIEHEVDPVVVALRAAEYFCRGHHPKENTFMMGAMAVVQYLHSHVAGRRGETDPRMAGEFIPAFMAGEAAVERWVASNFEEGAGGRGFLPGATT